MYHQLLKIGEEGIQAEIEYEMEDEDFLIITGINVGNCTIPVGAFDLEQIERMSDKLFDGHSAILQALNDDARIDAYEDRQHDLEI